MKTTDSIISLCLVIALMPCEAGAVPHPRQQASTGGTNVNTINVGGARPLLRAIEVLRERYGIAITYEEPRYVNPQDLEDIRYLRKGPVLSGPRLIGPSRRSIYFEYLEKDGKPIEDTSTMLRRLTAQFAAAGGPVFDVRQRSLSKGDQWNVVAVQARGSSGEFESQPDILGARIFIPKVERSQLELVQEMVRQLTTASGYQVAFGGSASNIWMGRMELGADNISAREVLGNLFGTEMVWDLNYDPEGDGKYILNLVWTAPPHPYSLDAYHLPPRPVSTTPNGVPPHFLQGVNSLRVPAGRIALQSKLAELGYYDGDPSGNWDEKTFEGLKKFQAANNLTVTGKPNTITLEKLGLFQ